MGDGTVYLGAAGHLDQRARRCRQFRRHCVLVYEECYEMTALKSLVVCIEGMLVGELNKQFVVVTMLRSLVRG